MLFLKLPRIVPLTYMKLVFVEDQFTHFIDSNYHPRMNLRDRSTIYSFFVEKIIAYIYSMDL
jgi:hypothetical protein